MISLVCHISGSSTGGPGRKKGFAQRICSSKSRNLTVMPSRGGLVVVVHQSCKPLVPSQHPMGGRRIERLFVGSADSSCGRLPQSSLFQSVMSGHPNRKWFHRFMACFCLPTTNLLEAWTWSTWQLLTLFPSSKEWTSRAVNGP